MTTSIKDPKVVSNAGVNGNNTADLLTRLDKDVLQGSPDLVILMVGTNDMLNQEKLLGMSDYEKNYQELITKIKKSASLVLMTIPPAYNRPQDRIDSANSVIRRLAIKNECKVIDIHKVLTACEALDSKNSSLFLDDGVHPTATGYRVIATAVYQTLMMLKTDVTRITCFGDSITYGYEMDGKGTSQGCCYPGFLKKMINL